MCSDDKHLLFQLFWMTMFNWIQSTHEEQARREWALHVRDWHFWHFFLSIYFDVGISTFLFVVICTNNFANTYTTSTNRFINISDRAMDISDAKHSSNFVHGRTLVAVTIFKAMLHGWKNKLLSETKIKFKYWHNIRFWRFGE